VECHLVPAFGHIKLQKLTVEHVQAFLAKKQGQVEPSMLGYICSVLSSALKNAMKWGLVARNVAELVELPQAERYEGQVLTVEQARIIEYGGRGVESA
jgi:integrase